MAFGTALGRFLLLYGALYAAFGVQSPYLPSLLDSRGLSPEAIALLLGAGTAIRLVAGPAAGRLADRLDTPKAILIVCLAAASWIATGYLSTRALWPLFIFGMIHSAVLAPLAPLSDALALGSAAPPRADDPYRRGFPYGWLRGAGSAAFIVGTILSGQMIGRFGINAVVWLNAGLLAAAAVAVQPVPVLLPPSAAARLSTTRARTHGLTTLLQQPIYRRVVLVAALVLGSHAMHDSFAMIRWGSAGIDAATAGLLWSLSVVGEVIVFLFVGRSLLDRLGPAGAAMLAASAGIVRWASLAETASLPVIAAIEPLHGLTFALLHLTCLRLLAESIPRHLTATALTIYGTAGIGASTALLTLASGPIYAHFAAHGFWAMAALCAAALPIARTLRVSP
jgi:MFS transporter, PPP family, 3-phenylpropionic acid transporter